MNSRSLASRHAASLEAAHPDAYDPDALLRAQRAFEAQHRQRLELARQKLPPTGRHILTALPLLLHANHPSLPGYCGQRAPSGLADFMPDQQCLRAVRQFTSNYQHNVLRSAEAQILGLYFMGSAGSVAHTRHSDLDIWVCLPHALHSAIEPKLQALTRWARALGTELQCFAVDPEQFTGGTELDMSPLLLDEFYRSGCYLAGRKPLWWLIRAAAPDHYRAVAQKLLQHRYVPANRFLDFGPVATFSRTELFAAGIRELERSLHTPYKSLLKLALLETYHAGLPPLSQRYKEQVHDGHGTHTTDGYLLLAHQLDDHFGTTPALRQRRMFLRRAWLTKISRGNTHLLNTPAWSSLAHAWHYTDADIAHLRSPGDWRIRQIIDEHHQVMVACVHALSFLNAIAPGAASATDAVTMYHKRLQLLRETILQETHYNDRLLSVLVPRNYHGTASIRRAAGDWQLIEQGQVLISRPRLSQLLQWLHQQKLSDTALDSGTRGSPRFRQIFDALARRRPALLLNAEYATVADSQSPDTEATAATTISGNDDPFCYGHSGRCLILHADLIHANQIEAAAPPAANQHRTPSLWWNDCSDALREAIDRPDLEIIGIGGVGRARLARHFQQALQQARDALSEQSSVFIMHIDGRICCFHRAADRRLHSRVFGDAMQLYTSLHAVARAHFHTQNVETDLCGWLRSSDALTQPTLVVEQRGDQMRLHYRDQQQVRQLLAPRRRVHSFCQSLSLFIARLKERGISTPRLLVQEADAVPRPALVQDIDAPLRFRLELIRSDAAWSLRCGQEWWHLDQLDVATVRRIRKHVLAQRTSQHQYPIYLTDLNLSAGAHRSDFLRHLQIKCTVEAALNGDAGTAARALELLQRHMADSPLR